jgi:hypothetical protein
MSGLRAMVRYAGGSWAVAAHIHDEVIENSDIQRENSKLKRDQ